MTTATPPVEYQAANVLGTVLRMLPDPTDEGGFPYGLGYQDHVANVVVFTVKGVVFHAVVTAA